MAIGFYTGLSRDQGICQPCSCPRKVIDFNFVPPSHKGRHKEQLSAYGCSLVPFGLQFHEYASPTVTTAQCSLPPGNEGDVQLDGLSVFYAGRVEICHNGVWGSICGESSTQPWSQKNAQVVCRQLGYIGAVNSILQDT